MCNFLKKNFNFSFEVRFNTEINQKELQCIASAVHWQNEYCNQNPTKRLSSHQHSYPVADPET